MANCISGQAFCRGRSVAPNLIANVAPDDRHLVASGIVGAFKSIWRDSWGPRLEYILYNAIAALLDCPNTSLLGVNRMLADADFRRRIVSKVRDPFVRAFLTDEFENYDARFQREAIAPIQNKVGPFLLNPVVRNILGQVRAKVSLPFMMNTGRIFIANLSKSRLGADKANLLGSLLTTQFQLGAMARVNQPESDRRDFFLFIGELTPPPPRRNRDNPRGQRTLWQATSNAVFMGEQFTHGAR